MGVGAAFLAAAYLLGIVTRFPVPRDFSYFWLAGVMWLEGANPYVPDLFRARANAVAASDATMAAFGGLHHWLYAPHIWPIASGLGLLDYAYARAIWGGACIAAILGGCWLALRSVTDPRSPWFGVSYAALTLAAATTLGTAISVSTGQFGCFLFLAVAAFCHGLLRDRPAWTGFALLVLMMKPSFGLAFLAAAVVLPRHRKAAVVAFGVAVIMAAHVFFASPIPEVVSGYLTGVSNYGSFEANSPAHLTGLTNLAFHLSGVSVSGIVLALLAAGLAALVAVEGRRRALPPSLIVTALLAVALGVLPLHLYDLTIAVLFLLQARPMWLAAAALVLNLVLFRVNRLADLVGLAPESAFKGSLLASIAILVFAGAVGVAWAAAYRRSAGQPGARNT